MIKLKSFSVNKYKCYNSEQTLTIDPAVTVLVGVNESGKTALLEALAKTNYFVDDPDFRFNPVYDYPRKEKKEFDKSKSDPVVVTCTYEIEDAYIDQINDALGVDAFKSKEFRYSRRYSNNGLYSGIELKLEDFWKSRLDSEEAQESELAAQIIQIKSLEDLSKIALTEKHDREKNMLESTKKFFQNNWKWPNPIEEYIARVWIAPRLPKFLYYSEYYSLPSIIDLKRVAQKLDQDSQKTAKALFELADLDLAQITDSSDYEAFVAELEATSNLITQTMFKYWKTNRNLRIKFDIDKRLEGGQVYPILNIRIENRKHSITLPLASRSKGFNWFFSFIVWFSKIQEDKKNNYVLLLDEPGLNLHAAAQADLLEFVEDLSNTYQVIYTTHSPFMIESDRLDRVRTIYETEEGTHLSQSTYDKDSNTIFPLQAALGYDIAQNLFISKNNLIVEGPADLIYLIHVSGLFESADKTGLRKDITIVPVGGADKVVSFVSLLKANKLNLTCLLDTFKDSKGRQRVDDLIRQKIIRERNVLYYHDFVKAKSGVADVEDAFAVTDYLKLYRAAFPHTTFEVGKISESEGDIISQINKALGQEKYNHYLPALKCHEVFTDFKQLASETVQRFAAIFNAVNELFPR